MTQSGIVGPEYGNIRISIHLIASHEYWDTSNRAGRSAVWTILKDLIYSQIKSYFYNMGNNLPGYKHTFIYSGGWWEECRNSPTVLGDKYNVYVEFAPSPRLSMPFDPELDTVTVVPPCKVVPPNPDSV